MRLKKLPAAICLTTLCALGALTAGGCAEDRTTLFVSHVLSFADADECKLEVSLSADGLSKGRYNTALASGYNAPLLIGNGIQPLGDNDTLKPETSRIQLEGAEIYVCAQTLSSDEIDDCLSDGEQALRKYSTPFSGTVHPDDSEDPGLVAISVPLIPASLNVPPGDYRLSIEVYGTTLGGKKVESGKFIFPILVINEPEEAYCGSTDDVYVHPCGWFGQDGALLPLCLVNPASCTAGTCSE